MRTLKLTDNLIENYEKSLHDNEKSKATIEKYLRDLRAFVVFINNRIVDKQLVLEYKAQLGCKYAPSSANSMIASINSFFRFAGWVDCYVKQFKIQKKTFYSEEKELSKDEYLSLVNVAEKRGNKRLAMLIQTICGTGIRVSEVKYITVEAVKRGEVIVSCKGKIRRIFIVSSLRTKLLYYAKSCGISSGMIFITKNGRAINRSNIWSEMKKICLEASVLPDKVFPHNLRHLFARTFYSIEKDISQLADILGHSNINTTRIYIISTGAEYMRKMESMRLII